MMSISEYFIPFTKIGINLSRKRQCQEHWLGILLPLAQLLVLKSESNPLLNYLGLYCQVRRQVQQSVIIWNHVYPGRQTVQKNQMFCCTELYTQKIYTPPANDFKIFFPPILKRSPWSYYAFLAIHWRGPEHQWVHLCRANLSSRPRISTKYFEGCRRSLCLSRLLIMGLGHRDCDTGLQTLILKAQPLLITTAQSISIS